ncbi:MAG: toll/interleukin-1 receptor domain-containing protein [Anaplasmataceae bacterium]|nr:toll/interleukin-1 receptor domain-containing protein [Anaplasmataceae bacterium]
MITTFLSYTSQDLDFLQSICNLPLASRFMKFIYDEGCGTNLIGHIPMIKLLEKIRQCSVFIPILSNYYLNSNNCQKELLEAQKNNKIIIPIIIDDQCHWRPLPVCSKKTL